jgi:hypothetical protein
MRKIPALCAALLLLIVLFPPADRVMPAVPPITNLGYLDRPGIPASRYNAGFVFITEVGGNVEIRYGQWLVQLAVIAAIGLATFVRRSTSAKTG